MRQKWFFSCACARCLDPTELGSYYGALLCQRGAGGARACGGAVVSSAQWGNMGGQTDTMGKHGHFRGHFFIRVHLEKPCATLRDENGHFWGRFRWILTSIEPNISFPYTQGRLLEFRNARLCL